PGERIAEMIVWQIWMQTAGPRQTTRRIWAFKFHVEGSDADALGGGHCGRITGEPDVASRIAGRREQARFFGPAQYAHYFGRAVDLADRAGRRILLAFRHEAAIDHHKTAADRNAGRREYPIALAVGSIAQG